MPIIARRRCFVNMRGIRIQPGQIDNSSLFCYTSYLQKNTIFDRKQMFTEVSEMAKKKPAEAGRVQLGIEKGLRAAAWILAVMHGLLSTFRFAVDTAVFESVEKWFALVLLTAALAYLLAARLKYPQTMYRIRAFFSAMRSWEQFFMIALFLWYALICCIWQGMTHLKYLKALDYYILDCGITGLILFPMALYAGKGKAKKYIESSLHAVVIAYTIFTGWCLWHVFHLNIIYLPSGGPVGMTGKMQLMIGNHYNITGAVSFTMLAVSCYMLVTQRTLLRVIYGASAFLHLWVCMLSNSRTVYVCVLFLGAATVFFTLWHALREKKAAVRILCAVAAAGAVILVLRWFRGSCFAWFDSITHFKALSPKTLSSGSDVRELTGLNGRQKVWLAALKTMTARPEIFFFGVTPAGVTDALKTYGGLTRDYAHAHNAVLQIGVSMGVPAMIAFVAFVLGMIIRSIRLYLTSKGNEFRQLFMIPLIIASLLIMNMAEAYLLYSAMNCVFFLACGMLVYMPAKSNREEG